MNNWPPGPSNPSPPPRVLRPPPGFLNPPPGFEPLPSTQPLFVNINNNTPLLHNNAPPLENINHPPPNLGNQDFPNPPNILDFVHLNNMPHLHNMFCQCCSTTRHGIQMLRNRVTYIEDDEIMVKPKEVTKIVKPSFEKIESVNARNETVRQAEKPKKNNESTRGNKRSYNGMMTHEISIVVKKANVDAHGFVVHGVLSGLLIFAGTTLFMIGFNREQEGIKGYGYREEVVVLFCKLTMLHSKELASPKQTALELDYFGATANELDIRIDNEEKLGEDASKQGRIDDADAEATFIDETLNDARNKNNNISNNN
ncbi:hypothetical protein Tco_0516802 [Tanacetum coccineum]